jgi:DnaJ-class molecular chaperone
MEKYPDSSETRLRATPNQFPEPEPTDYYESLGISRQANQEEINQAYKRLSLQHHPDRYESKMQSDDSEKKFKHISDAYQILSNEDHRVTL